MRDWRDEERSRQIEEMHAQQVGGSDDLWGLFVMVVVVFLGILVVAGLLDSWFGWGLTDLLWAWVYDATDGILGKPNK